MNKKKVLVSNSDFVELDENGESSIIAKEKITEIINRFVGKQYENTLVLTGAGSSILTEEGLKFELDTMKYSGKTVSKITEVISTGLGTKLPSPVYKKKTY